MKSDAKAAIKLLTYVMLVISMTVVLLLIFHTGAVANAMVLVYWIVLSVKLSLEAWVREREDE